jgi:hypothetical protein
MLLRLAAILAALLLVILALRWFARLPTPVARRVVKRTLMWGLIAMFVALAATGRLQWLYAMIGALLAALPRLIWYIPLLSGLLRRYRAWRSGTRATSTSGKTSTVESRFVRMTMNHDSGEVEGIVLEGAFRGSRLDELEFDQLLELLRECRLQDEESARLLEAWLDRHYEGWQEARSSSNSGAGSGGDMSVEEALQVLGLEPDASEEDIVSAHRRLMQKMHPDRGGSAWVAARINQAKDVLMRARGNAR